MDAEDQSEQRTRGTVGKEDQGNSGNRGAEENLNENLFIKGMTSTSGDEEWLCCDHTFDITGRIGYERREDKKWIRQYSSLFWVMNEKG